MIPGIRVGHATDPTALTGCTVILPDAPAVGGVEIRGWAAGVHGLEFLDPRHLVPTWTAWCWRAAAPMGSRRSGA